MGKRKKDLLHWGRGGMQDLEKKCCHLFKAMNRGRLLVYSISLIKEP